MRKWIDGLCKLFRGQPLPPFDQVRLIDVRTPAEFSRGHLEGAHSLPLDQVASQARAQFPDLEAPLVVYCQSGMRSAMARKTLLGLGYRQVFNGGGIAKLARRIARSS